MCDFATRHIDSDASYLNPDLTEIWVDRLARNTLARYANGKPIQYPTADTADFKPWTKPIDQDSLREYFEQIAVAIIQKITRDQTPDLVWDPSSPAQHAWWEETWLAVDRTRNFVSQKFYHVFYALGAVVKNCSCHSNCKNHSLISFDRNLFSYYLAKFFKAQAGNGDKVLEAIKIYWSSVLPLEVAKFLGPSDSDNQFFVSVVYIEGMFSGDSRSFAWQSLDGKTNGWENYRYLDSLREKLLKILSALEAEELQVSFLRFSNLTTQDLSNSCWNNFLANNLLLARSNFSQFRSLDQRLSSTLG